MEENITSIAKFLLLLSPIYIGEAVTQGSGINKHKISLQRCVTSGKYRHWLTSKKHRKVFLVVRLTQLVKTFQLNSLNAVVSANSSLLNLSSVATSEVNDSSNVKIKITVGFSLWF